MDDTQDKKQEKSIYKTKTTEIKYIKKKYALNYFFMINSKTKSSN